MIKYDKYKPSNIEWIGEIPEYWEETLLKYTLDDIICGGTPSTNNSNYWATDNNGIPWVSIADITESSGNLYKTGRKITIDGLKSKNLKIIPKETLLISIFASLGKTTTLKINASVNQAILGLVAYRKLNKEFLKFYLNYIEYFIGYYSSSNTQENLNLNKIKNLPIVIPPKPEQTAIANYLDRKTAEIDELISQKQQLLKLYEEEKTAIINQAVTKGIYDNKDGDGGKDARQCVFTSNPHSSTQSRVSYKDSGIDWLGKIPEHWELKKIKHLCYVKGRVGWKGLKSSEFLQEGYSYLVTGTDFKTSRINWKNCYHIDKGRYEEDPYIQLENRDLLITKDGTIGKLAIVENLDKPACLNSGIFVVRSLLKTFSTEYLYCILDSNIFKKFNSYTSYGSTIQHLYQNVFVEFAFGVPCIEEQTQIVQHIETETALINTKAEKTKKLIDLLKEYKTALISEVVTGKVKVI